MVLVLEMGKQVHTLSASLCGVVCIEPRVGLLFPWRMLWDQLHAAPFVDVSLRRNRGLAVDSVVHCPDRDGMCSYKPRELYFGSMRAANLAQCDHDIVGA
jgi:hypothetical protein